MIDLKLLEIITCLNGKYGLNEPSRTSNFYNLCKAILIRVSFKLVRNSLIKTYICMQQ
jgi:hypothetical protein